MTLQSVSVPFHVVAMSGHFLKLLRSKLPWPQNVDLTEFLKAIHFATIKRSLNRGKFSLLATIFLLKVSITAIGRGSTKEILIFNLI